MAKEELPKGNRSRKVLIGHAAVYGVGREKTGAKTSRVPLSIVLKLTPCDRERPRPWGNVPSR